MLSSRAIATIIGLTTFVARVSAYGVILPLYIYPDTNCVKWTPVFDAVAKYNELTFYIIVNYNSGPGAGAQPDATYQACVPKLKPAVNPNVFLLGYVPTGFGARAIADVNADIAKYVGWNATYKPNGIFFDEVTTTTAYLSRYQDFAWTAWRSFDVVTLNPGTTPAAGYYAAADLIVTQEKAYGDFSPSQLVIGTNTPASKQSVILHSGPAAPPTSLINSLGNSGLEAVFFTDVLLANNPYGSLPSQWNNFVAAVNAENVALYK